MHRSFYPSLPFVSPSSLLSATEDEDEDTVMVAEREDTIVDPVDGSMGEDEVVEEDESLIECLQQQQQQQQQKQQQQKRRHVYVEGDEDEEREEDSKGGDENGSGQRRIEKKQTSPLVASIPVRGVYTSLGSRPRSPHARPPLSSTRPFASRYGDLDCEHDTSNSPPRSTNSNEDHIESSVNLYHAGLVENNKGNDTISTPTKLRTHTILKGKSKIKSKSRESRESSGEEKHGTGTNEIASTQQASSSSSPTLPSTCDEYSSDSFDEESSEGSDVETLCVFTRPRSLSSSSGRGGSSPSTTKHSTHVGVNTTEISTLMDSMNTVQAGSTFNALVSGRSRSSSEHESPSQSPGPRAGSSLSHRLSPSVHRYRKADSPRSRLQINTEDLDASRRSTEHVQRKISMSKMIQNSQVEEQKRPRREVRHWKQGEMIGKGGYGEVFCVLDEDEGEMLAMKRVVFNGTLEVVQDQVRQLQMEISLLQCLSHRNIVEYRGCVREGNALLIFMEYVPGGSISSLLHRFGRLHENVVRKYTRQLLIGLEFLHRNRIVHRDIKGANILVDTNGDCKLADFGASKRIEDIRTMTENLASVRGTPWFMAPEVIREDGYGRPADIWSVGCTVIEMATGRPPFSQYGKPLQAMFHIAAGTTDPPVPDVLSEEGKDFVRLCLKRNPKDRPTAESLLQHAFVTSTISHADDIDSPSSVSTPSHAETQDPFLEESKRFDSDTVRLVLRRNAPDLNENERELAIQDAVAIQEDTLPLEIAPAESGYDSESRILEFVDETQHLGAEILARSFKGSLKSLLASLNEDADSDFSTSDLASSARNDEEISPDWSSSETFRVHSLPNRDSMDPGVLPSNSFPDYSASLPHTRGMSSPDERPAQSQYAENLRIQEEMIRKKKEEDSRAKNEALAREMEEYRRFQMENSKFQSPDAS